MAYHSKHTRNYRDDLLYLMDMRDSHLTHPKKMVIQGLFQPSFARLFCVFMIGEIEATFINWSEKDEEKILAPFFLKKASNEKRIDALELNFSKHRIEVDREILDKYLAIKYVRNAIIHSKSDKDKESFIKSKGFPINAEELTDEHLCIMYKINKEMVRYITSVEKSDFNEKLYGQYLEQRGIPQTQKYYTKSDFMGFLWWNIEQMEFDLSKAKDGKILDDNFLKSLIFTWSTYKEKILVGYIDFEKLSQNLEYVKKISTDSKFNGLPDFPIGEADLEIIKLVAGKYDIQEKYVSNYSFALSQSRICFERMKNGSAASLFDKIRIYRDDFDGFDFNAEGQMINQLFDLSKLYARVKDQ